MTEFTKYKLGGYNDVSDRIETIIYQISNSDFKIK